MNWDPPPPAQVRSAIASYLAIAYDALPPLSVRARLDLLNNAAEADFYHAPVFERIPPGDPSKFCIRLGNRFYPHMKLVIERSPDGTRALFRADTHDRHVQPKPDSPEAAAFAELARKNQELAQTIESKWDDSGLPTFKQYLRDDLARRLNTRRGE